MSTNKYEENRAAFARSLVINDEKFIKYMLVSMKSMPRKQKMFVKAMIFNVFINLLKHYPLLHLKNNTESTEDNGNATENDGNANAPTEGKGEADENPSTINDPKPCIMCTQQTIKKQNGGAITKAKLRSTTLQSGKVASKNIKG